MKTVLILFFIFTGLEAANANFCSYNTFGDRQFCMSDYDGCLAETKRRGIKINSDICRKENQLDPKYSSPADAKEGTCLWMLSTSKKWDRFSCYKSKQLCKSEEAKYKSQVKVECR